MTDLQIASQRALKALQDLGMKHYENTGEVLYKDVYQALQSALAEPVLNPAPGYCKHCKQYTIEEPLPAEPVEEPVAWSYDLATTRLDHRYDGWIRRITQHKPNVPEGSIRNLTPVYHIPPAEKTTGNLVHIKLNVMRTALENIVGIRPIVDNLLSDKDIARIALERIDRYEHPISKRPPP